ncbi:MAG TPA: hypothetical protein VGB52_03525 [Actinomycetota bacterium]
MEFSLELWGGPPVNVSRSRAAVALAAVAAAVLVSGPAPPAQADHCNRIVLHSGTGLLIDAGLAGCHMPAGHVDTDHINPGSSSLQVRVLGTERPSDVSTLAFPGLTDSRSCADGVCGLTQWTFEPEGTVSHPEPLWDSAFFSIARASSVDGGEAVVTICFDDAGTDCVSRTYRTLA